MNNETYFEVGGIIYVVTTPSTANNEPVRFVKQRCYPINIDWRMVSIIEPLPYVEPRWDSTEEKRAQARKDYGWGGATWKFA
jgi:hypothetical protein